MTLSDIKANMQKERARQLLTKYKVKKIALFGSCASGVATSRSDIDFLVEFEETADLLDQVGLKQELEDYLKRKVDIVTRKALHKYIRKNVLAQAVYL
jgi:predicted nucleotidyltransferase